MPDNLVALMPILIPIVIWDLSWKGVGLWKAARNDQLNWYIAILLINSVGILPIIYIYFFSKKESKKNVGL